MKRKYSCGLPTSEWPPGEWAAINSRGPTRSRRSADYKSDDASAKELKQLRSDYGWCLALLKEQGPIALDVSAARRWSPFTVSKLISKMTERGYSSGSIRVRLNSLRKVLSKIDPTVDLSHITEEIQFQPRAKPAVPAAVLRVTTAMLVEYGIELMDATFDAEDEASATTFMTGLQIALLALRSWRAEVFSSIQISVHLKTISGGWRLVAPLSQSRFKKEASGPFPARLVGYLNRYLAHHHGILSRGACRPGAALWIGPNGGRFSKALLHSRLTATTRKKFGDAIYPHAFRKCLTTTIAIESPAKIHAVSTALGHGPMINEYWYNMAGTVSAFDQLGDAIEGELRDGRTASIRRRQSSAWQPCRRNRNDEHE